jgi:hypothetical protein
MKNIFLILILLSSTIVVGQTADTASIIKKIIGKPVKIGDLLVAQNDMPFEMNFDKANIACNELGSGWRLPTYAELFLLYKNKDKIGGFTDDIYWSSAHMLTTDNFTTGLLFIINFFDKIEQVSDKKYNPWSKWSSKNHVRAVRSTNAYKSNPLKNIITFDNTNPDLHVYKVLWHDDIIGKPIIIGHLEVAQIDLEYGMDWNNAKLACADLGEGWRLPTKDELIILFKNKAKISNLTKYRYWSSTEENSFHAWSTNFTWGESYTNHKNDEIQIRAVRSKTNESLLLTEKLNEVKRLRDIFIDDSLKTERIKNESIAKRFKDSISKSLHDSILKVLDVGVIFHDGIIIRVINDNEAYVISLDEKFIDFGTLKQMLKSNKLNSDRDDWYVPSSSDLDYIRSLIKKNDLFKDNFNLGMLPKSKYEFPNFIYWHTSGFKQLKNMILPADNEFVYIKQYQNPDSFDARLRMVKKITF